MKHSIRYIPALAIICGVISLNVYAENPAPGYVDFGKFSPAVSGGEFVEVNVKSNLIAMVARLTKKEEPEVAELLRGLQLIRVNVIGLNEENRAEIQERVKTIRGELDAHGWESIVTAQQKNEDVRIYLKIRGDEAVQGLVVTVLEGNKQAVLVNIVGDIKPEKLAEVGEQFNIDPLKKIGRGLKKDGAAQK
jgi:MoaA/NifB/PqqE/SkfB family radical SAM enzyme